MNTCSVDAIDEAVERASFTVQSLALPGTHKCFDGDICSISRDICVGGSYISEIQFSQIVTIKTETVSVAQDAHVAT